MLDDGTGVIGLTISGDFLQRQWFVGMYVMVVGPYLLRAGESPVVKVCKLQPEVVCLRIQIFMFEMVMVFFVGS